MSLLSLCLHNKTLFPASCLKSPISQLANSLNISCGLIQDWADGELSPPLSPRCISQDRQEEIPPGGNGQLDPEGDSSSWQVGWGPRMHNGTQWDARTRKGRGAILIRLARNQVQIQACPRRQEWSLITSQWDILVTTFFTGETMSVTFREQDGSMVLYEGIWKCKLRHSPAAKWVKCSLLLCVCLAVW
jgi:hypothetical protein